MRISDWSSDVCSSDLLAKKLVEGGLKQVFVTNEQLVGSYISADFINEETGEVIAEAGDELSESLMNTLVEAGAKEVSLLAIDHINVGAYFRNTLAVDKNTSREAALIDISRATRPGGPPTLETAEAMFHEIGRARRRGRECKHVYNSRGAG